MPSKEAPTVDGERWMQPNPRLQARAWRYFKMSCSGYRTRCNLCGLVLRYRYGATSGMIRHLRRIHSEEIDVTSIVDGSRRRTKPARVVSDLLNIGCWILCFCVVSLFPENTELSFMYGQYFDTVDARVVPFPDVWRCFLHMLDVHAVIIVHVLLHKICPAVYVGFCFKN